MEGEGFEPSKAEPSDLQSDPFNRSGTPPNETDDYEYISHISQSRFTLSDLCDTIQTINSYWNILFIHGLYMYFHILDQQTK